MLDEALSLIERHHKAVISAKAQAHTAEMRLGAAQAAAQSAVRGAARGASPSASDVTGTPRGGAPQKLSEVVQIDRLIGRPCSVRVV